MAHSWPAEDEGVLDMGDRLLESWTQLEPPVSMPLSGDAQQVGRVEKVGRAARDQETRTIFSLQSVLGGPG